MERQQKSTNRPKGGLCHIRFMDPSGKKFVVLGDFSSPTLIRRPKVSSDHAPMRQFPRAKVRYQRVGDLLVMRKRRARGEKSGKVCPVIVFPI